MYLFNVSRLHTKTSSKFSHNHLPFSLHNPILQICVTASFLPFSIVFPVFSCSFLSFYIRLFSLPPCLHFLPCMTENTNFHTTSTLPSLACYSFFNDVSLFHIYFSYTVYLTYSVEAQIYKRHESQSVNPNIVRLSPDWWGAVRETFGSASERLRVFYRHDKCGRNTKFRLFLYILQSNRRNR